MTCAPVVLILCDRGVAVVFNFLILCDRGVGVVFNFLILFDRGVGTNVNIYGHIKSIFLCMSTCHYVLPVFGKKNKIMKVMCSLNESYLAELYYITVSMHAI